MTSFCCVSAEDSLKCEKHDFSSFIMIKMEKSILGRGRDKLQLTVDSFKQRNWGKACLNWWRLIEHLRKLHVLHTFKDLCGVGFENVTLSASVSSKTPE